MDWDLLSQKLKGELKKIPPGNTKRLEVLGIIQGVDSRVSTIRKGYGHADYLLNSKEPEDDVIRSIKKILPDFKFSEDKIKNERE